MSDMVAGDRLKSLVDRIERLETEKADLANDIKEIYMEAKSDGFDVKILRKVIKERRKNKVERETEAEMLGLYLNAIGCA